MWQPLGSGFSGINIEVAVTDLQVLPDGDLAACGYFEFAGGVPAAGIARWDGSSWSALATTGASEFSALVQMPDGDLVAGGDVQQVDGVVSVGVARLTTTCPATAALSGTGCIGSGGINWLVPLTLPWQGSTFRSLATGLPGNSLAIAVRGLSTASVPLPALLPQGLAGCSLLVTPDVLDLHVPQAGVAATACALPAGAAFAGIVFYQQVVALDLTAQAQLQQVTSTNRLVLTVGSF